MRYLTIGYCTYEVVFSVPLSCISFFTCYCAPYILYIYIYTLLCDSVCKVKKGCQLEKSLSYSYAFSQLLNLLVPTIERIIPTSCKKL